MPKNHAKSIKGMSIACIALSGVIILCMLVGLVALAVVDDLMVDLYSDPYYSGDYLYDYYDSIFGAYGLGSSLAGVDGASGMANYGFYDPSYGYYDYYDDYASYKLFAFVGNVLLVCGIIVEAIVLAASIIVLRNHNKPEKFNLAFGWSIVGAVLGILASGVVQGVLFIIIAVFINSDKKLYRAGMYYVAAPAGAAPGYAVPQPGMPVPPTPGAPVPVAGQSVRPVQPGQPMQPVQPGQPAATSQPAAQGQVAQPLQPAAAQPQPSLAAAETQPPVPEAEQALVDAVADASVSIPASEPIASSADAPASEPTPVIVDEGAVIRLSVEGVEPAQNQPSAATPSAAPGTEGPASEQLPSVATPSEGQPSEGQPPETPDAPEK